LSQALAIASVLAAPKRDAEMSQFDRDYCVRIASTTRAVPEAPLTKQQKGHPVRPRSLQLRAPRSSGEWARYHEIRERCLFEKYHRKGTPHYFQYDPGHPDESDPENHPLVFLAGRDVIGTIRIDIKPNGRAIFRLVAIDDPWQGHGLGTAMLIRAEDLARDYGADTICLNAVPDAYRFYARHGFTPERWEGCTSNPTEIPVVKHLAEPAMLFAAIEAIPVGVAVVTQVAS
jgi:GNAT superfamily N-acetyltransferase